MSFDPSIAARRFGCGLSPAIAPPESAGAMIRALTGPDLAAAEFPIPGFSAARPTILEYRDMNRERREARATPDEAAVEERYQAFVAEARALQQAAFGATFARRAWTADGLRERLMAFWANHFTVRAKIGLLAHLVTPFVEEVIRPRITGRFADMLIAVTLHPMMLAYLDQSQSIGPNAPAAARRNGGLNENLARELLELHTLGVDGPYTQDDVREVAELLTGLGWDNRSSESHYRADFAEPGAETVLGATYSAESDLSTVVAALEGLAAHPATAGHIARKLARHFVADDPPAALVADLAQVFLDTGGDLLMVTATLLDHPESWGAARDKVLPPLDYLGAALRALAVAPDRIMTPDRREHRRWLLLPLGLMGQPFEAPNGPDGWSELGADWITPQFMAGRIDWAMRMPAELAGDLPDPRDFALAALGEPPPEVEMAAAAAEDRATGVAVVLASAAFNRR